MTDNRKEFEEWCSTTYQSWAPAFTFTRKGDGYEDNELDSLWEGWLAHCEFIVQRDRVQCRGAKP